MTTTEPRHMGETRELRAVDYKPLRLRAGQRHDPEPTTRLQVASHRIAVLWFGLPMAARIGAGLGVVLALATGFAVGIAMLGVAL